MDTLLQQSIDLYLSGLAGPKVSAQTGICLNKLYRHLKIQGLCRSNKINSRKYFVDDSFFNVINQEEKAYWLGFMYADGHIAARKTQKVISICQKDSEHLEKFKEALSANYPINQYTSNTAYGKISYFRLCVTSDKLFDDLKSHGCVENKSLILDFPSRQNVPEHLVHHFIRGYFDGDGSFSKAKLGFQFRMEGTKEFLTQVMIEIGFPNRKLSKRKKDLKNNYSLGIGGRKQVLTIGNYMYKNCTVAMDRKLERFKNLY